MKIVTFLFSVLVPLNIQITMYKPSKVEQPAYRSEGVFVVKSQFDSKQIDVLRILFMLIRTLSLFRATRRNKQANLCFWSKGKRYNTIKRWAQFWEGIF
jgi:hypothetical protein